MDDVQDLLDEAQVVHDRMDIWANGFGPMLRKALKASKSLPAGWVWQDYPMSYLKELEPLQASLKDLEMLLKRRSALASKALPVVVVPTDAEIDQAIDEIRFFDHPATGERLIAYRTARLQRWHRAFMRWLYRSQRLLAELP